MQGPRYAAGDWNHECHKLSAVQTLRQAGWVEVQELRERQTGHPVEVTCKHKTRKDFLWLSPELAVLYLGLTVDHTHFVDHALLTATFSGGSRSVTRYLWPCPAPIDWNHARDIEAVVDFSSGDPSLQYRTLWEQEEKCGCAAVGTRWAKRMSGRAAQTQPCPVVGWSAPVKKGRSCDVQPGFLGFDRMHAKWFKQLRRIQNYVRWISAATTKPQFA